MGPETLASFLGEYLTPMTELVLDSGGTLDKYIGDAVMAFWAAPVDMPDHAARACEVALRMQEALVALNKKWQAEGKPAVAIGIGINTGAMAVGNMGSAARFEYTVLGDQVNLGARLEALTKEYGVGILVGEATAKAAGAGVRVPRGRRRAREGPRRRRAGLELVGRAGTPHRRSGSPRRSPRIAGASSPRRKRRSRRSPAIPCAAAMAKRCAAARGRAPARPTGMGCTSSAPSSSSFPPCPYCAWTSTAR